MGFTKGQENAINARGQSILVSAGAGSGKTSVLIERLIKILSDEENKTPAEKVIVVTFTKDAASQIRQRLSRALEKKLSEEPDNLWLMTQQSDLCFAKISTIHSFCFDMIRDNAELAGVLSDFRIADENEEKIMISSAVKTVIGNISLKSPDMKKELRDFFCNKKDYELGGVLERFYKYAVSMPFYEDILSDILLGFSADSDEIKREYTKILSEQARDFSETALFCKGIAESVSADNIAQTFENEYNDFIRISKEITDEKIPYDDRIAGFGSVVFKTMPKFKPENDIEESVKTEYTSLRNKYKEKYKGLCKDHLFRNCDIEDDREIHKKILSYLIEIVKEIDDEINLMKEEKNVLGFSDAERVSVKLLCRKDDDGNIVKTELAKELSKYYGEIMIDEYQDSNAMQDLIFRMLSKDSENLFAVGDIKQSIYRFRQSDPTIFVNALKSAKEYSDAGEKEPAVIRLNNNFRSSGDVVDFVNFTFSLIMSEKVGEIEYSDNQALEASAEYPSYNRETEIIIINEEDEEYDEAVSSEDENDDESSDEEKIDVKAVKSEALAVASKIKEMLSSEEKMVRADEKTLRRCQPRDFCILTRTKNAGLIFAEELEKHGVRVANEDVSGYLKSNEMSVLINLLKIIDNPLLDIPMASVMMSAMFMITPDEMAKIRLCKKKAPIYSAVCEAIQNENEEYYPKLRTFKDSLDKLRLLASGYSLEKLIRTIYDSTDYLTVMQLYGDGERKKANLRLILEYAKGYEQNYNGGLSGFVRYINTVFENGGDFKKVSMSSESDNVVSIKTIHKSKGLEYPFVFLCSVSTDFNKDDLRLQIQTDGKNGIGFKIRNRDELKYYDSIYHYVYRKRNESYLASEEMRLLYVAMTRAKDKLFITFKNDKKFVSALSKAAVSLNTNGGINEGLTSKAECMADWILPVLMIHPDGQVLRELCNGFICKPLTEAPRVKFTFWEDNDVSVSKKQKAMADEQKLNELKTAIEYDYDFSLSKTAAKLTVTEIVAESREMTLKRPKFVTSEGKLSGAEKGTATHLFMQYCDMSLAEKDVSSERDRLYENGLLGNKESKAIEIPLIEKFFESELYSRMKAAEKLQRERKFLLRISDIDVPDELKNSYKNTDGMIQGVIDCLFEEDDGIVVVDYKTDSSKDEEALKAEYAPQLILYKAALEAVYGKKVKEAVIYSFRLGKEIRISA
mgnify:CR=1 FL=1